MKIGIIGTGLIGASIGMRSRELGHFVMGFDADGDAAQNALLRGALDETADRERIYESAQIIIIAAHVSGTLAELERLRFSQPRAARLIMDVASVKAPIARAASGVEHFVPTHPMAGRECSGPGAATADVFEEKTWLFVPTADPDLDRRAVEFIESLGAFAVPVEAAEHDRTVAFTSHLPQVLATLFADRAQRSGSARVAPFMGPTARELMRLSRSGYAMWADILDANSENIVRELRALARSLESVAQDLQRGANPYREKTPPQPLH